MRRRPRLRAGAATPRVVAAVVTAVLLGGTTAVAPVAAAPRSTATPTTTSTPTLTPTSTPTSTPTPTGSATPDEGAEPDAGAPPVADPLRVVLHRLRPAVLPEDPRDEVTVTGNVRNRSPETWSDLNVYLVTSQQPITSSEELAAAVGSDPDAAVGDRVVEPGLYDELGDLAAGEVGRFRLSVPRRVLEVSGDPGVYWLGVHVLGTSEEGGRDVVADGRARTFLPSVPRDTEGTELAVAAQFRGRVVREPDGRLALSDVLARRLAREGRLQRLLALSRTADAGALTWVVDPAVVEAVASLAAGDPPYAEEQSALPSLDDGGSAGTEDGTGEEPGAEPSDEPGDEPADEPGEQGTDRPSDEQTDRPDDRPDASVARRASRWLTAWTAEAGRHEVLTLPYGDLDVAAAYAHARATLLPYALDASDRVLGALGITSTPVVAPPTGHLPANALTALPPEVLAVLAPEALPGQPRPLVETATGTTALVAGTAVTTRGPGPGVTRAALAVRQRLLAACALHALSADRGQPVVAVLPAWWDPGPRWQAAHLFDGLSQPWLDLVEVADVRRDARSSQLSLPEGLDYPEEQAAAELGADVLAGTSDLITQGATYESVFVDVESVGDRLGRQALLTSSFWSRARPRVAVDRARTAGALVESMLDEVTVRSPTFVTLSSEDGDFLVTLANGLGERVRVGLRATVAGSGLELSTPEPVTLEPNERRSVLVTARSDGIGIHQVQLQPTTESGLPVGSAETLSVRSSSVGLVLWAIMAGGAVVLFGAIALRLVRRVRRRRATHGPVLADHAAGAGRQEGTA